MASILALVEIYIIISLKITMIAVLVSLWQNNIVFLITKRKSAVSKDF